MKHSFAEDRVAKAIDRLISAKSKGHQHRISDFFKPKAVVAGSKRKL